MRDQHPRRWQQWRIRLVPRPAEPDTGPLARRALALAAATADGDDKSEERPGKDGIRHELVARVRREIEAGTYDTEEKWLLAEARLLQHAEGIF